MGKNFRISEAEISRNKLPESYSDSFDVDILRKVLEGSTLQTIAQERYLSIGIVSMRLKNTLIYLQNMTNRPVDEAFFKYPERYKNHWLALLAQYSFKKSLEDPASMYHIMVDFFKTLNFERQTMLLTELETIIHESNTAV